MDLERQISIKLRDVMGHWSECSWNTIVRGGAPAMDIWKKQCMFACFDWMIVLMKRVLNRQRFGVL